MSAFSVTRHQVSIIAAPVARIVCAEPKCPAAGEVIMGSDACESMGFSPESLTGAVAAHLERGHPTDPRRLDRRPAAQRPSERPGLPAQ